MSYTQTIKIIELVAPDVADDHLDSELDTAIELATARVSSGVWGDRYRQGVAYLAAHVLTIAAREGSGVGPITSEKAGKVSRSYGFSAQADSGGYGSTEYGKQFLQLRSELPDVAPLTAYGHYD